MLSLNIIIILVSIIISFLYHSISPNKNDQKSEHSNISDNMPILMLNDMDPHNSDQPLESLENSDDTINDEVESQDDGTDMDW